MGISIYLVIEYIIKDDDLEESCKSHGMFLHDRSGIAYVLW